MARAGSRSPRCAWQPPPLGTTTAQNVVSAEQTAREVELRRLQALVAQLSTRFQLEHAAGTLLARFATL